MAPPRDPALPASPGAGTTRTRVESESNPSRSIAVSEGVPSLASAEFTPAEFTQGPAALHWPGLNEPPSHPAESRLSGPSLLVDRPVTVVSDSDIPRSAGPARPGPFKPDSRRCADLSALPLGAPTAVSNLRNAGASMDLCLPRSRVLSNETNYWVSK